MGERRRVIGAAGGAVGLSGFAAALGLCCSVPWAVALLGVTGPVGFARLAFLLPYALIGAGALLAVGFWLAYRPMPLCPDGSCAPETRRPLRIVMWMTTALVATLAIVALTPPAAAEPAQDAAYTELDDAGYAWDVWLIYGPDATWDGALPPRPRLLMHQLRALQGSREFPRLPAAEAAR